MPKPAYKKKNPAMWLRYALLGGLLMYVSYIGYMHLQHQTEFPPVDAICPFGGLESLFSIVFHGTYLQRIFISSFILLGITILLVFLSGRSFCGWICPLGTLQGIFAGIGRRLFGIKQRTGMDHDGKIRWLRYPILIIFTVGAWYGGKLLIRPYDPWVAWMHIWDPGDVIEEFPIGLAVLVLSLALSIFIPRAFCRYLCPMGMFLGVINRFSPYRLHVNQETCIHCMACDRKCPVGIPIASVEVVNKTECLSCGECVPVCPVPNTIEFRLAKKRIVSPIMLGVIVIVVFFGIIGLTKALGVYRSKQYSVEEMKLRGAANPEDIRGYVTLAGVAELFDMPLDTLYSRLALDRSVVAPETKSKDIGSVLGTEFEADSVRAEVARWLGREAPTGGCDAAPPAEGTATAIPSIMGTHTLREVADMTYLELGVLYNELGLDSLVVPPDTPCRDLKELVGPDFHTSKVREAVARLKQGN